MNRLACLIVSIGLTATAQSAPEDDFAAAYQEGQKNEHDGAAGTRYIQEMVKSLGPALTASSKQCSGTPAESKQQVQMALQLNIDGSVRKVIIVPNSPHWDCVKAALSQKTLPAAPRDAFWTSGTIG